jgi:hypothetical protein
MSPFDPQYSADANERAKAVENAKIAIAQVKLLKAYAGTQLTMLDNERRGLQPVTPFAHQKNDDLARQYYDLKDLGGDTGNSSLDKYLNDLNGRLYALVLGQPGSLLPLPAVPADILAFVQSIKDGVPYVEPVHTG